MIEKPRAFKVGDKVTFGARPNGLPIWSGFGKSEAQPWRTVVGVVTKSIGERVFVTRHTYLGRDVEWTWPQPTVTPTQYVDRWGDPAYVKHKGE